MAATLVVSAVSAGSLAGFALGAGLAWLPAVGIEIGDSLLVTLVGSAIAADLIWSSTGRLRPLRVNGQVPRAWSSIFSAPITAGLYGARLGIGPLTMLNTWMWWAASVGAALLGVIPSTVVGASFAAVRVFIIISTSLWAEGVDHQPRFERLRRVHPGRPLRLIGAAAAALLLLGACTEGARPEFADDGLTPSTSRRSAEASTEITEPEPTRITAPPTTSGTGSSNTGSSSNPDSSPTSTTSEETTAVTDPGSDDSDPIAPVAPDQPSDPLATALVTALPGFDAIDDPVADRALDIEAAANIQPDPTEELPLLETRGFAGGWTRAFRNPSRDVIVTTVYEFVDNEEAAFYLEDGLITIGGYGGEFFEVPDIEGSRGFRQEIDGDEPLLSVGVTFVRDNRWFLVYVIGGTETVVPEALIEAARLQAAQVGDS